MAEMKIACFHGNGARRRNPHNNLHWKINEVEIVLGIFRLHDVSETESAFIIRCKRERVIFSWACKGPSTLLVLVLAKFVLVGRLVWLLLVLVNLLPHYFSLLARRTPLMYRQQA
jgi:hypothetical protein